MAQIGSQDLIFWRAAVASDADDNGGKPTFSQYVSGVLGNVFPLLSSEDRESGLKRARKVFAGVAVDSDAELLLSRLMFHRPVDASHRVLLLDGTAVDTQADVLDAAGDPVGRRRGVARLAVDVAAGDNELVVDLWAVDERDGTTAIFQDGDRVLITDKASWDSATGQEEMVIVTAVTPSVTEVQATLTLASPLQNSYSAATTAVASVSDRGTVAPSMDDPVLTVAGDGDLDASLIKLFGSGTPEETITLTFTAADAFDAAWTGTGTITGGGTSVTWAPRHPDTGKVMLEIPPEAWSGTWASGDTVELTLHQDCVGVWLWMHVPPAAPPVSGVELQLRHMGESA